MHAMSWAVRPRARRCWRILLAGLNCFLRDVFTTRLWSPPCAAASTPLAALKRRSGYTVPRLSRARNRLRCVFTVRVSRNGTSPSCSATRFIAAIAAAFHFPFPRRFSSFA